MTLIGPDGKPLEAQVNPSGLLLPKDVVEERKQAEEEKARLAARQAMLIAMGDRLLKAMRWVAEAKCSQYVFPIQTDLGKFDVHVTRPGAVSANANVAELKKIVKRLATLMELNKPAMKENDETWALWHDAVRQAKEAAK